MREILKWLVQYREEPFDIEWLSIFHIVYLLLAVSIPLVIAWRLVKGENKKTEKYLRALSITMLVLYIGDFFAHPLMRDDYGMNVDKLPFHICTLMCIVVAFTQFNAKFERFREPVAFLSVVAPLMYICYPGTAIGTESPFSYEILQTFAYHGTLYAWGVTNIATGRVKPNIRNWYKSLIGICMIAVWAGLGNMVYNGDGQHYDWFFLTGSTFPFVPKFLMPFAVIAAVFGMVMIIYGIYYLVKHIIENRAAAKAAEEETVEEKENVTV